MIKLKPGMEVRCRDERQAKEFIKLAYEQGYSWPLDLVKSEIEHTSWENADKRLGMVYCLEDNYLIKYRVSPNIDNGIIEYSVLVKGEYTTMKKSDLKNGMVVELRNGKRFLIVNDLGIGKDSCINLDGLFGYDENLYDVTGDSTFDITKIYKTRGCTFNNLFDNEILILIWEREEEKQELSKEDKQIIKKGLKIINQICKQYVDCDNCELYAKGGYCVLESMPQCIEVDKLFEE